MNSKRILLGRELGVKLCEAVGLDPSKVSGIKLETPVDGAAMVTANLFVTEEQGDKIFKALSEYKFVPDGKIIDVTLFESDSDEKSVDCKESE